MPILPSVDLILKVGGNDISKYIKSMRLSYPWGGKSTVSAEMVEFAAENHQISSYPTLMFSGGLSHYKYPATLGTGFSPSATDLVDVLITVAGVSSDLPTYIKTSPKSDGTSTTINGSDLSALMELRNQNMPDIFSVSNPKMSDAALNEIAARYGTPSIVTNWSSYKVRQLRRTGGTPIDWVDQLARPYQAARHYRGQVMHLLSAKTYTGTTWNLTDYETIQTLSVEDSDPPINRFTVSRTNHSNILGQADCTGGQCVGRTLKVTFSNPTTMVTPVEDRVVDGVMINYVYFDATDKPINATSPTIGPAISSTPIARVEATYQPTFTQAGGGNPVGEAGGYLTPSFMPEYHVIFYGEDAGGDGSDTTYTVVSNNTTAQGIYGIVPNDSPVEDPILPSTLVAQAEADCLVYESTRKSYYCHIRTPWLNPAIHPGDNMTLTDEYTNQSNKTWFIEQVDFIFEGRDQWFMELILTKGPVY